MVVVFKVSNEVLDFLGVMHGTQLCTLPPLTRGNRSYELTLRWLKELQQWLYCREHLKYVWNVYCIVTNHRRDLHTTETTGNKRTRGVARIFQRGVTVCQNEGTHQIVMSFSPPVVGCLLKKAHKRGGHRHPRTPPGYAPANSYLSVTKQIIFALFKDTSCLITNLKHRCSPRSVLRTASRTSFNFGKKNATRRRQAFQVTTYHIKKIKNEQSWCFHFW